MHLLLVAALLTISAIVQAADEKPEVFVQLGHTSMVQAIAVSPDGRTLAAGDFTGQVKLWDTTSRQEVFSFPPSTHPIMALAFSPDGGQIFDTTANGWLGILDVSKGRAVGAWKPMRAGKEARAVAVSAANARYAVGGLEQEVRIVSIAGGEVSTPRAENSYITSLAFTPDGLTLIGADGKAIRIWDAASGALHRTILTSETVASIAVTRDGARVLAGFGNFLSTSDDKVIRVYEIHSGNEVAILEGITGNTYGVAVSPNGLFVATAHGPDIRSMFSLSQEKDTSVRLWDLRSGKLVRSFKGHDSHVMSVAWHPDGRTLYSASWDNTVRAWAVETGDSVVMAGIGSTAVLLPLDNATDSMTSVDDEGRVWRWDLETGRLSSFGNPPAFPDNNGVKDLPTPIDARLVKGDVHTLLQSSVSYRFQHSRFNADGSIQRLLFDANSVSAPVPIVTRLRAKKGVAVDAFVVALVSGGVLAVDARSALLGISYMATGNFSTVSIVTRWDLVSDTTKPLPVEIEGKITAMAYAEGNRILILASESQEHHEVNSPRRRMIEAREIESGRQVWQITGLPREVEHIVVSPKGDTVLVASEFEALVVDLKRGNVRRRFGGHTKIVSSVAFSPDGVHVLTGSVDQRVRVWNLSSGTLVSTFFAHLGHVKQLRFVGGGRFIASSSADQTLRLWRWPSAEPVTTSAAFRTGDWVTLTPEGYFAGSPGGVEQLGFRYQGRLYSLNQFYDAFYRPDLVQRKLRGERIDGLATTSLTEALDAPPPVVRVEAMVDPLAEKVRARLEVSSTGGGIGEIRVFHNGKLIRSDGTYSSASVDLHMAVSAMTPDTVSRGLVDAVRNARAIRPKPATPRADRVEDAFLITPVSGDNEISVIAFNANNTVQSRLQSARFVSDRAEQPPRLFLLAIGIDRFRGNSSENLAYAAKDARDFTALLQEQSARLGLGTLQPPRLLTDMEATRDNIQREFSRLEAETRPQDAFILFVASHGVINAGSYAIVTHDYEGRITPSSIIRAEDLIDASKRISAQRQLMILDTCHAGGLDLTLSGLYDARMTLLARNIGLHAFASAGTLEQAIDGYEKNGLFTHAMLRGLRTGDADADRDQVVSVFELGEYSKSTVAGIASRSGFRQTPLVLRFGKDLPFLRLR